MRYKQFRNYILLWVLIWSSIIGGLSLLAEDQEIPQTYPALFGDHSKVYDGDTIQDVYIVIKQFENRDFPAEALWPGVFLKGDTLYAVTDIRVAGIDTPEKRPKKAGRTPESLAREKAAAAEATREVQQLLESNNMEFVVAAPQQGKYSGRTVAKVYVGKAKIDVGQYLINKGLAYPYDGGTKQAFDDWYQK